MEEVAWDKGGDKGKASSKRKQLSLLDGKYRTKYLELGKRAGRVNRVWNCAANSKEMNKILEKGNDPKMVVLCWKRKEKSRDCGLVSWNWDE